MTLGVPRERPTAAFTVRDLSAPPGRASAPPEGRRSEDLRDRARRHRGPIREACVCGGPEIVAVTFLPHDVMEAVQRHQIEPVHLAYDLAHGIALASWQATAAAIDAVGVG